MSDHPKITLELDQVDCATLGKLIVDGQSADPLTSLGAERLNRKLQTAILDQVPGAREGLTEAIERFAESNPEEAAAVRKAAAEQLGLDTDATADEPKPIDEEEVAKVDVDAAIDKILDDAAENGGA